MRERNLVVTGAIGLTVMGAMLAAGLSAGRLAGAFGSESIEVEFANAAGLKTGDPVRISGIKVGKVDDIRLGRAVVIVKVQVDDAVALGGLTSAAIKVETVLGTEYVALQSAGPGRLDGERIPVTRTRTPFDLQQVLGGLTDRVNKIDTEQLAGAFEALSGTLDGAAPQVRAAVDGVTRLSTSLAARDVELRELLAQARTVTNVVADRSRVLVRLVDDAGTFLAMLERRQAAIESLVVASERLGVELTATARSTRGSLAPALKDLSKTIQVLRENKGDIEESVQLYAPLLRYYTTVLGSGRWFDAALFGLTPKVLPGSQPELKGNQ